MAFLCLFEAGLCPVSSPIRLMLVTESTVAMVDVSGAGDDDYGDYWGGFSWRRGLWAVMLMFSKVPCLQGPLTPRGSTFQLRNDVYVRSASLSWSLVQLFASKTA